ncbi:MAG TPA: twin-arginine translocase TatA/TatE family subunit, partial [Dehalococcoidia bacterium]
MPLLAGLGPLGVPELLIIAFIVVLIFGVGRLPEVGGAVGKGIREFRKNTKDEDETPPVDASASA